MTKFTEEWVRQQNLKRINQKSDIVERTIASIPNENPVKASICLQSIIDSIADINAPQKLCLVLKGQVRGGKNNITVTRTGKRIPNAKWAKWRDEQVKLVKSQLPKGFKTITVDTSITLDYAAGDRRRRDMPAIIDSVFHVLEKAGVVSDDTLLWVTGSSRTYSKESPCCEILFH